jgi:hypothetical protein
MNSDGQSVTVAYREREGKPTIPVGGAYGGPSPDGANIVVHVYVEYGTVPTIITAQADAAGRVNVEQGEAIKRSDGTREVLATLVLAPEVAASVGRFLIEKAEAALEVRKMLQTTQP